MNDNHSQHIIPLKVYFATFAALMGLLVVTLLAARLPLGSVMNNTVALTIAIAKATLVVLYFMHVRYSSKLVWLWAGVGFAWLLIMFGVTLGDYVARAWVPVTGW